MSAATSRSTAATPESLPSWRQQLRSMRPSINNCCREGKGGDPGSPWGAKRREIRQDFGCMSRAGGKQPVFRVADQNQSLPRSVLRRGSKRTRKVWIHFGGETCKPIRVFSHGETPGSACASQWRLGVWWQSRHRPGDFSSASNRWGKPVNNRRLAAIGQFDRRGSHLEAARVPRHFPAENMGERS